MRSYPVDSTPLNGGYATPNELHAEAAEMLSVLHSLDRENLAGDVELATGGVTLPKLANQAMQTVWYSFEESTNPIVLGDSFGPNDTFLFFNEDGYSLALDITTDDGVLEVVFSGGFTSGSGGAMWIGVKVDGVLVARSPTTRAFTLGASLEVDGVAPVRSGPHRVEFVGGIAETVESLASTTLTITPLHMFYFLRLVTR